MGLPREPFRSLASPHEFAKVRSKERGIFGDFPGTEGIGTGQGNYREHIADLGPGF